MQSKDNQISKINWQIEDVEKVNSVPIWQPFYPEKIKEKNSDSLKKNKFSVKSLHRSVKVNDFIYPEISNYVPNGFLESSDKFVTFSLRGISKTRQCNDYNFSPKCIDGVLETDFNLFSNDNFSFNSKITFQSLTNRGTKIGEGISLGFKSAALIFDEWSLSIGGENIIHFDESIDLGKNFYFITSKYFPLNNKERPAILFVSAGIGSDFYGYLGNGFLARTYCPGIGRTLTGDGSNNCNWGPIGSVTLALNDKFAVVNEWFGYSYGTGFSLRPFKNRRINLSIYATDYIKGLPSSAQERCLNNSCKARYYGGLSYSF